MEHFHRRKQHQPLKQLSPRTYQSPTSSRRPSVSVGDGKWLYVLLGRLLTPEASSVARRQCQGMPLCLWGPVVMVCNHGCSLAVETGPRHFSSLHSRLHPFISTVFPCQWRMPSWKHYKLPPSICFFPEILLFYKQSIWVVFLFLFFTSERQSLVRNKALFLSVPFEGTYPLEKRYHSIS